LGPTRNTPIDQGSKTGAISRSGTDPDPHGSYWRMGTETPLEGLSTSRHGIGFHVKHLSERLDLIGMAGED
jgi:hypothetical protein